MKKSFLRPLLALVLSLSVGIHSANAVTQQTAGHVFDGSRPYLYVEAESYSALVDADVAAESANLQSLQVRQQLNIQALSIANQQPNTLLSLFR